MEKVFAKPFIGSLDGHRDGLTCLAKHPSSLSTICSADASGEARVWQLTDRKCVANWAAHTGVVRGVTFTPDGKEILTVGDDKTIKTWNTGTWSDIPTDTIVSKGMVNGISHGIKTDKFATCGEATQLWTRGRAVPTRTFQWGVDTVHHVKFNPVETHLLGACASDRLVKITISNSKLKFIIWKVNTFVRH